MPEDFAGKTEHRNLFQLLLHDPFEIDAQPAVKDVDVVETLVIGRHHIRHAGSDVFGSLDGNGHRSEKAVDPGPEHAADAADARRKQEGEDNGADSEDKRGHDQQRKNKQPFVGLVKDPTDPAFAFFRR